MAWSIARTFSAPEPMPSKPDSVPAPNIMPKPSGTRRARYSCCPSGADSCLPTSASAPNDRENHCCRFVSDSRGEKYAENKSTMPKMMPMVLVCSRVAKYAPRSAPNVVAISRNMPIRIFEKPSDVSRGRSRRSGDHRDKGSPHRVTNVDAHSQREHRHHHDAPTEACEGAKKTGEQRTQKHDGREYRGVH